LGEKVKMNLEKQVTALQIKSWPELETANTMQRKIYG